MRLNSPNKDRLSPKDGGCIAHTLDSKAISVVVDIAVDLRSSPYSNPISLKDSNGMNKTVVYNRVCKVKGSVINQSSSPYNSIHSPEDNVKTMDILDNKAFNIDASMAIGRNSSSNNGMSYSKR